MSYTEAEFQEASAAGKLRLVFLLHQDARLPEGSADADRSTVERFRARLDKAGLIRATFTTAADLELEVLHALTEAAGALHLTAPGPGIGGAAWGGVGIHGSSQTPLAREPLRAWGNVPARNPAFAGREEQLARIRQALAGEGGRAAVQALHGMGGVGKTQLAIEYAHRHSGDYDVTWWLDSENTALMTQQYADLAEHLGAAPASGPSPSALTGHGPVRSSPAGSCSAPCQHPPDQHEPPARQGRRHSPAQSEPVRTRAPRAPPRDQPRQANRHHTRKRTPAQSVTRPQNP